MGIRFLCPTCRHRLNVKGFLAGKRGVCPQCGAGLDIPLESQIKKESKGGEEASDPADLIKPSSPVTAEGSPTAAKPTSYTDEPWLAMPAAAGTPVLPLDVASPPAAPQVESRGPLPVVAVQPVGRSRSPRSTPLPVLVQPSVPMAVPIAVSPAGTAQPTVPMAAKGTSQPGLATAVAVPVTGTLAGPPTVPMGALVTAPAAVAVVAAPSDPIEEAPEAIWYVRPPSGGQYGPARGDIMRKWIVEGRVSQDSLVWREGWNDWRTAGQVFPSLGMAASPPPPVPQGSVVYAATAARSSSARPTPYPSRRRSSLALAVATVTVLTLMSVALLIVLFLVISRS